MFFFYPFHKFRLRIPYFDSLSWVINIAYAEAEEMKKLLETDVDQLKYPEIGNAGFNLPDGSMGAAGLAESLGREV